MVALFTSALTSQDHPGYWDEIVSSAADSSVKKRAPENWREHEHWFSELGLSDWVARFNKLNLTKNYGLAKAYRFISPLYQASKFCPPSTAADMSVFVSGKFDVRFDFGITLVVSSPQLCVLSAGLMYCLGELRSFDFSESYANFSHNDLSSSVSVTIYGNSAY
jgi:hypothetical protein